MATKLTKSQRIAKKQLEQFAKETENIGRQTIKIKRSKGFIDYYGRALSGIDRTLRTAKYDERNPDKKQLSITEKLILEGQKRKAEKLMKPQLTADELEDQRLNSGRLTKETVDRYCKEKQIGTYNPEYVPSKTGLKSLDEI